MTEPTNPTVYEPVPTPKTPPVVMRKPALRDNKAFAWFTANLLYPALFLGALVTSSMMTWEVIGMILPGNIAMQWLSIGFYDGGALVWWLMHVIKARGNNQRMASLTIFIVDLLGAAFMIFADLYLGGQTLVTPPAWLGRYLINITSVVMFANLAAGYYYHANSPEDIDAAKDQDQDDDIQEIAREQQRAYVEANIHALAAPMYARAVARFKMRNSLPMTDADYAALEGEYVDGQVIPALPARKRDTFWSALLSFFGGGLRGGLSNLRSGMNTASPSNPSPSDQDEPPTV